MTISLKFSSLEKVWAYLLNKPLSKHNSAHTVIIIVYLPRVGSHRNRAILSNLPRRSCLGEIKLSGQMLNTNIKDIAYWALQIAYIISLYFDENISIHNKVLNCRILRYSKILGSYIVGATGIIS